MGLDCVELVITWEREFSISIPNDTASTLITPKLAADAIEKILLDEGRPLGRKQIEQVIKATTLEISGADSEDYSSDMEFVRDFGLD
jgi:acyl carrier protein